MESCCILLLLLITPILYPADAQTQQIWSLRGEFSSTSNAYDDRWSYYLGTYGVDANDLLPTYGSVEVGLGVEDGYLVSGWHNTGQCAPTIVGLRGGSVVTTPGWICCTGGCPQKSSIVFRAPSSGTLHMRVSLRDVYILPDDWCSIEVTTRWILRFVEGLAINSGTIVEGSGHSYSATVDVEANDRIEMIFDTGSCYNWGDIISVDWTVSYQSHDIDDLIAWYENPYDVDGNGVADAADAERLADAAGVDTTDCDANGVYDEIDIHLRPCWDEDLDGLIDFCSDPEAPHDPQCSYPTNLHVGPAGADDNTATVADPLETIAFALSLAAAGDTITILPGAYTETELELSDDVFIRGGANTGKDVTSVILDANNEGTIFRGSNLTAGVTLEGLTLVRAGSRAVVVDSTVLTPNFAKNA